MEDQKLQMGLRRNRGRILQQSLLENIAQITQNNIFSVQFLSLEQTDEVKQRFYNRVKDGLSERMYWEGEQETEVLEAIRSLQISPLMTVAVFHAADYYTGALILPIAIIVKQPFELMWVLEYDLAAVTLDLQHGILLSLDVYAGDQIEYELVIWGIDVGKSAQTE